MIYHGIVITGTEGSEIAAVASKLCEKESNLALARITTTKGQGGKSDGETLIETIGLESFEKMFKENKLVARAQHGKDFYGIAKKILKQEIGKGRIPVFIAPPELVLEIDILTTTLPYKFFTVFLDAPDNILDKKLASGGQITPDLEQRQKDRQCASRSIYIVKNTDQKKTVELLLNLWEYRETGGLLPEKLINLMIDCGVLLENADTLNATSAAYDLVLDDEYYHNGKVKSLNEKDSFIKMKPGDYALVGSKETANFPKDIAARFGLSVSLFFQGIILSNGPQIDPGFRGRLYCLLFNTSSDEVQLKRGQHYATIEFIKLLEPTNPYKGGYQDKNKISDYLPKDIPSSAIGELRKDVENLKAEKLWIKILPLTISLLSIAIALALALPNLIKIITGG